MTVVAFLFAGLVVLFNFIREEAQSCNAEPERPTVGGAR